MPGKIISAIPMMRAMRTGMGSRVMKGTSMLHWEQSENELGLATWLRYIEISHWGLILTAELPRYLWATPKYDIPIS